MKIDWKSYPLSDRARRVLFAASRAPLRVEGRRYRSGDETFSIGIVNRLADRHILIQQADRSYVVNTGD